jgi:group I intron endonuclease
MARGIYKIINVLNDKFYVGSAVDFARRKREHWNKLRKGTHHNKYLQTAWNKYEEAAFIFAIVTEMGLDDDILQEETKWLKEHVGKEYCYNLGTEAIAFTTGWSGEKNPMWGKTFSHTEEAKAKIAEASSKRIQSKEERVKRRRTMRGHIVTRETRAKISATLSGAGNPNYGKPRSDDFKIKVSKPIQVTKPDGETIIFASITALREELSLKPPTVNRAVKSTKPLTRGPYKGWTFTYLNPVNSLFE